MVCPTAAITQLQGFRCDGISGQRLGPVLQKGGEWSTDQAAFGDEAVIEICEAQEMLKFLDCCELSPVLDGTYLPLVQWTLFTDCDVFPQLSISQI